ncbi:MAG: heterodisulfide reductase subunit [Clostridia bacterium]|nr:heterodisulfide reductase subunit [Clostridia bacterium]
MKERLELAATLNRDRELLDRVQRASGVSVKDCYQCGKCSAGCPAAFAMDYTPRQVIRLLQLGMVGEALKSHTIWVCAHCQTCYTRCPKEVDLPRLMEALRQEAKKAGFIAEKNIDIFDRAFLSSVERYGRVHEMGMMIQFNLQSLQPFKDALLAPPMLLNRKLNILPEKIKDGGAVKRIFAKVRAGNQGGDEH